MLLEYLSWNVNLGKKKFKEIKVIGYGEERKNKKYIGGYNDWNGVWVLFWIRFLNLGKIMFF